MCFGGIGSPAGGGSTHGMSVGHGTASMANNPGTQANMAGPTAGQAAVAAGRSGGGSTHGMSVGPGTASLGNNPGTQGNMAGPTAGQAAVAAGRSGGMGPTGGGGSTHGMSVGHGTASLGNNPGTQGNMAGPTAGQAAIAAARRGGVPGLSVADFAGEPRGMSEPAFSAPSVPGPPTSPFAGWDSVLDQAFEGLRRARDFFSSENSRRGFALGREGAGMGTGQDLGPLMSQIFDPNRAALEAARGSRMPNFEIARPRPSDPIPPPQGR